MVLIGASTGGIDALLAVLSTFGADCPAMVIVQHTGHGFGDSLAALLDRNVAPRVRPAIEGARLDVGTVHVCAGGGRQVCLETGPRLSLRFASAEPVSGHCPSVDFLFRSAVPVAGRVSAAILTGMGRDGAEGLDALRRHGAWTVAQDAATSVVFGMPRAAAEIGAAAAVLPIDKIGPALLAGKAYQEPPTRLTP
jgi:two-component system chemotaxis response regulator CheB